ncbi:PknH-like extracellular domain-containing protein [Streptomyces sp. DvalAA-14]|uniref:hypothetical protein n=1 Tax=unclassified Streptomyces TaxID=2593676 RepID=UPI00081B5E76|nr:MULTISPECIES: hypothetical protein [unclassified Streptomyces]MYS24657.1 hypothetical protein [Streptomyces sp. SID4948]SCE48155.1 PknH-like extracellular domain-containing protein [Streptomyces sp. DvalAA-14]
MRKTRCAAASLAVLPALLLAAACSGNSSNADGSDTTPKSTPSASATTAGKAPLTKAQLTSALVTTADVPGWTVQVSQTDATDSQDNSTLTADKPQCQPLADITSSKPKIRRLAFVGAAFAKTTGQATPDQIDQMLVASHAPGDAQKVIDSVKAALATCTTFNAVDNTGTKTPFAITKGPAVGTGDASASYVMTDTADKKTGAALVSVVKSGDTITAYLSVKSAGGAGQLPLDVARKQNDKLKAAQAG